jgi:hypothetical protein
VHRAHPLGGRRFAVQQVQEVSADRVVVGFDFDAPTVLCVVKPIEQHRAEGGHQPVGDVASARHVVVVLFRQCGAQHRAAGAHHVHRMRSRRHAFERRFDRLRQTAQRLELRLVTGELGRARQLAVHQQIGDFLEFALLGDVEDVVTPVVQVVAAAPDRAERGIPRGHAGERDRFLGLEARL